MEVASNANFSFWHQSVTNVNQYSKKIDWQFAHSILEIPENLMMQHFSVLVRTACCVLYYEDVLLYRISTNNGNRFVHITCEP